MSPFLKIGIICASVKKDGNFEVFTTLALYYANKKPENISAFFLSIFVGISVSWHALVLSKLKIYFNISFQVTSENENKGCLFDLFLHTSPIVSMIGWFLYFKITWRIG